MDSGTLWILYELLLVVLGMVIYATASALLSHHDAKKNHRITILEWQLQQKNEILNRKDAEIAALQGQLPPKPVTQPMPVKPLVRPLTAFEVPGMESTAQQPKSRPAADTMPISEAWKQLNASGHAAMRYDGKKGEWTV